jgi:phosphonate transport system substrate-binding protein
MNSSIRLPLALLVILVSASAAAAPAPSKAGAPPGKNYSFAVSEGTSGSIDPMEAVAKYRPLADVMQKIMGRPVNVSLVRSFEDLEAGMSHGDFDFVMARPSDYPARGVRDYKYNMIAASKPDGQCVFIVEKSSPLKKITDIKGKNIIFPERIAYMTKFCVAELRDKGIDLANESVKYAREQGAVAWSVEKKLMDVGGVASYSGAAKSWEKDGNRILHKSIAQPYSPLIAHQNIPADKVAALKAALGNLGNTEDGKKVLKTIGIQALNPESSERLLALLAWLEKTK